MLPANAVMMGRLAVIVLAFGGGLVACSGGAKGEARPAPPPVPVTLAPVVQKDVPVDVRAVGTAEAVSTVQVLPQVSGLIQEVHFREGDTVKKGQLLFTID